MAKRPTSVVALGVFLLAVGLAFLEAKRVGESAAWRAELWASVALGAVAALIKTALALNPLPAHPFAWALFGLVFLADDFLYYAAHRMAHRINAFWVSHAVHHSSTHYNFFMGLRQPPSWLLTPAAAAPALLIVLGAPAVLVALSGAIRALHHFALHTERVGRLPLGLELVFNTPSHHRVHHSSETRHLDRNFGGVLIVWDRLFSTFAAEPAEGVARYGLVGAGGPQDLFAIVAGPWRALGAQVGRAGGVRDKAGVLLGPPGHL